MWIKIHPPYSPSLTLSLSPPPPTIPTPRKDLFFTVCINSSSGVALAFQTMSEISCFNHINPSITYSFSINMLPYNSTDEIFKNTTMFINSGNVN
jgi:hypothetical protein